VLHAAGWLEGGLVAGYEKFVLDCELLGMLHIWPGGWISQMRPWRSTPSPRCRLEATTWVRPTPCATSATPSTGRSVRLRKRPNNGKRKAPKTVFVRANHKVQQLLADYEPPDLDPVIEEALEDYMSRRKAEIAREPHDFE